ncbi:PREDICTED: putative disease resistance protein At1g50180 [Theobroma cacao]|uniref:Disease resistance protein At1g50180 n=2 Tax=Theobroma cacao TaxID=3641 RepID=A0AB32X2R8_THECC|nr:PREDICTED: putative disease resistance protein At1g50180 [Theobroma cacao]EOY17925.1 Disease resistance protein RPP8 [Theobroma cacao]
MAEAIVFLAIERIADLLIHEALFLNDVRQEVESLKAELERMKSFLKDVDRKQEQDERLRTRVREIRDLAYDAEDVIDSYILEVAHRGGFHEIIKRFTTLSTHKVGKQVRAIQNKLGDISRTLPAYGISGGGGGSNSTDEMQRRLRRSYPHVEEDDVVSLELSTRDVIDQLMKKEDRLHVVSIVGMGGIGKTTLAKRLYNHNDVKRHFDCCAWVFISQQCLPREVFHGVLMKVLSPSRKERKLIDKLKEDELVEKLYDVLKEKRYLVVLDDIWSYKDWDSLKPAFPKGQEGSKLLLTTRKKKVALLVDPCSSPVELPLLTDDESWKLFKRKAFSENKMEAHACSKEFEMLGKEMLKKCGGLPLAIVVLGGLLATKKSWNEWEMVQKNINAYLNKDQRQEYGGVTEILALSYNELPFHLKPCFLYLGHYPEDLEISKKELVRLWIAEGFISPSLGGGEMLMEDVAEQYLEELTNRCLVQVGRRNHTGASVKTCYIHDLLRDLCVSKAREENFFGIVQPSMNGNENCSLDLTVAAVSKMRRIVVHPSKRYVSLKGECPNLRSLLLFQDEELIRLRISKCNNFKFLRILKLLREVGSWIMPSAIGYLFHLRYLSLKCRKLVLPCSIGKLKNLHTLSIQVEFLVKIPNVLSKLERLRHFLLNYYHGFKKYGSHEWHEIKGFCQVNTLENIETMKYIRVENLTKNNALLKLTNIRSLGIQFMRSKDVETILRSPSFGLDRLRSLHMRLEEPIPFPTLEQLSQCHHLYKLFLHGRIQEDPRSSHHVLKFLPTNICKLTLWESHINQDPMPVLEKLPHLRILCLGSSSYRGTKMSCSANGFPQLDSLHIYSLDLKEWQMEVGAMPCLRSLHLTCVPRMKMFPEGLRYITTLQEMKLKGMRKSLVKRIQVIEGREGEDFYKVRHILSIRIIDTWIR